MARSPLFRLVRAASTEIPPIGLPLHRRPPPARWEPSRRAVLRAALGLVCGAVGAGSIGCSRASRPVPRDDSWRPGRSDVVIIGAGLAGLHCAYRLARAGVMATVCEASNGVGGRVRTSRGDLGGDRIAELGGEFINSEHATLIGLVGELGLTLEDRRELNAGLEPYAFFFERRRVTMTELASALAPLAAALGRDLAEAETDDDAFGRLDQLSIAEWLENQAEASELLRSVLSVAMTTEYGIEVDRQSALNLIYLLAPRTRDGFHPIGESDERYRVAGGNDGVATRLAERLDGQLLLGHRLEAVTELGDGRFRLAMRTDGGQVEVDAVHVVFALPFTMLRRVDLRVELPADKRRMIDELGYGTNAKLLGQFERAVWRQDHDSCGYTFTDNGLQALWDASDTQPGPSPVLTNFVGGRAGIDLGEGDTAAQMGRALPLIDAIYPGAAPAYRGLAIRAHWPTDPFVRGSYSGYTTGQWAFWGREREPVGNLHFCGEHCSPEFQGYMEGACETGAAAAAEILAAR